MKKLRLILLLLLIIFSMVGLLSWRNSPKAPQFAVSSRPISMCGSILTDWSDTTTRATLLPGLGTLTYKVTTSEPKAQQFFDQGLRLVYGFNHWEAIQAFREASRLDPECAMAYWGLALAYGPNLNDVNPTDRERLAFESIQKAIRKKGNATPAEKGLIDAMAKRYDGKVHAVRDSLNLAYAEAMGMLTEKFPNDPEVLTLAADANMNTMPWDYWEKDGAPKPRTKLAKNILEKTLRLFPSHPGAHHLYIHLVEASDSPESALPSADVLAELMPGAGHLVHMPGHIYIRVGNYSKMVTLNQRAAQVDEEYLANSTNNGMYRLMYYPHNVDFISYGALMEGRSVLSNQTALKMAYKGGLMMNSSPGFGQYLTVEPIISNIRFGKWTDILSLSRPDQSQLYTNMIWRFGRGLAQLRVGNLNRARFELNKLDSLSNLDTLKTMYFSFNPMSQVVKIPLNILRGEILMKEKNVSEAMVAFRNAIEAENELRYNEPPDWKLPPRQFLGAALLESSNFSEAEKVFVEDLRKNPENGWSLKGLMIAQEKQGKKSETTETGKRFEKAWKNADIKISSSRF